MGSEAQTDRGEKFAAACSLHQQDPYVLEQRDGDWEVKLTLGLAPNFRHYYMHIIMIIYIYCHPRFHLKI
jgi:hypothetical protein